MDGLFDSFARLDSRISSVGQTAAKIGDHLQVLYFKRYLLLVNRDMICLYIFLVVCLPCLSDNM